MDERLRRCLASSLVLLRTCWKNTHSCYFTFSLSSLSLEWLQQHTTAHETIYLMWTCDSMCILLGTECTNMACCPVTTICAYTLLNAHRMSWKFYCSNNPFFFHPLSASEMPMDTMPTRLVVTTSAFNETAQWNTVNHVRHLWQHMQWVATDWMISSAFSLGAILWIFVWCVCEKKPNTRCTCLLETVRISHLWCVGIC